MNYHQDPDNQLGNTTNTPKQGDIVRIVEVEETPVEPRHQLSRDEQTAIIEKKIEQGLTNRELGIMEGKAESTIDRIVNLAKFTKTRELLKGLGVKAGRISAQTYDLLEERLTENPQRFNNSELAGIATFASQRAESLLSREDASLEPSWDDLEPLADHVETKGKVIG